MFTLIVINIIVVVVGVECDAVQCKNYTLEEIFNELFACI